jgi:hypothetical protein
VFDFRYHALSLVAVFLALAVGLLLGVAIGDRGLVSSAEQGLRDDLKEDVRNARDESQIQQEALGANRVYDQRTYPAVVRDLLRGRRVVVVFTHGRSDEILTHVDDALRPTGGRLESQTTLRMPMDLDGLQSALAGSRYAGLAEDDGLQQDLARDAGREIAEGSGRLVGDADVRTALFTESSGTLDGADAVVLVRSDPGDRPRAQANREDAFERAFIEGLHDAQVPVVGVETTTTEPSQIGFHERNGMASVDDVDQVYGWASLVLCLTGSADGAYGVKDSRDAFLPEGLTR